MSELLADPIGLIDIYGNKLTVGVQSDWEVEINGSPEDRYSKIAGLMVHAFTQNIDSVTNRAGIYNSSFNLYKELLSAGTVIEIEGIGDVLEASRFGSDLAKIMKPKYSPIRTNILNLDVSIKKWLLLCSAPEDKDLVKSIIAAAKISETPEANPGLQNKVYESYLNKRSSLLRIGSNVKDSGSEDLLVPKKPEVNKQGVYDGVAVDLAAVDAGPPEEETYLVTEEIFKLRDVEVTEYSNDLYSFLEGFEMGSEITTTDIENWLIERGYRPNSDQYIKVIKFALNDETGLLVRAGEENPKSIAMKMKYKRR
jgi:hypothetical protein